MSADWTNRRLGSFASLQRGLSYSSDQLRESGAAFINLKSFAKGGGYRPEGLKRYAGPPLLDCVVQGGDLLIANTDLTRDASIVGAPALVPDSEEGPVFFSMDASRLDLDAAVAETRFLFYRMQLQDVRSFMQARSAGSTVLHLHVRAVPELLLRLPPLPEQRRIAEILATLDEAIRKTEWVIAKLQQTKQGLLRDLLTRGIDEHGELRDPVRHPEQFKDSALGQIPMEWKARTVDRLLAEVSPAMRSGPFGSALMKHELVSKGVPLLGIDNVHVERFDDCFTRFVTPQKAVELSRYLVRPRDVLVTIMGTVGRCALVPDDLGRALSSKHVWTLTFDHDRYSPYLAGLQFNYAPWVLSHFGRDEQGGIMSAIRSDTLRTTLLPVPPPTEQRAIEAILTKAQERLDGEEEDAAKLRALKLGLMDDLLRGHVRVPELEEVTA